MAAADRLGAQIAQTEPIARLKYLDNILRSNACRECRYLIVFGAADSLNKFSCTIIFLDYFPRTQLTSACRQSAFGHDCPRRKIVGNQSSRSFSPAEMPCPG